MSLRRRLTLVLCVAALGTGFAGCYGSGYNTGVYVGVSGPGPYYGGGVYGPYGGGYWGPGRVHGGVVITGRP
jgi:hypothetical protein